MRHSGKSSRISLAGSASLPTGTTIWYCLRQRKTRNSTRGTWQLRASSRFWTVNLYPFLDYLQMSQWKRNWIKLNQIASIMWLVGGSATPLKNMKVNWLILPNIWENKIHGNQTTNHVGTLDQNISNRGPLQWSTPDPPSSPPNRSILPQHTFQVVLKRRAVDLAYAKLTEETWEFWRVFGFRWFTYIYIYYIYILYIYICACI